MQCIIICCYIIGGGVLIFFQYNKNRMTVTRPDEYGVEETVTELVPGKQFKSVFVMLSNIKGVSADNDKPYS